MILNIHVKPSANFPTGSICTTSLSKDVDTPSSWEKTSSFVLDNPERVMNELLEMFEDIKPTGDSRFGAQEPNGIKEYMQAHAVDRELKLTGEKFDPEQVKLRIFATCVSKLDKAVTKYVDAQGFMQDLYKDEPEKGIERMSYISKHKQKMPHWTNPTEETYLHAVWDLNQTMNDVRKALEPIGKTTPPDKYPQTIASLVCNLHIVQMMDLERTIAH